MALSKRLADLLAAEAEAEAEAAEADHTDRPIPPHVKASRPNRANARGAEVPR